MEAVRGAIDDANNALMKSVEQLDAKLRPVQRAFFACGYAATSDTRGTMEVAESIEKCQEPFQRVQQLMNEAQGDWQTRIRGCHEKAGAALDPSGPASKGKPTDEEMSKYATIFQPCVAAEIKHVGSVMAPVYAAVPKALADIQAATPAGGPQMDAAGGKKGWW